MCLTFLSFPSFLLLFLLSSPFLSLVPCPSHLSSLPLSDLPSAFLILLRLPLPLFFSIFSSPVRLIPSPTLPSSPFFPYLFLPLYFLFFSLSKPIPPLSLPSLCRCGVAALFTLIRSVSDSFCGFTPRSLVACRGFTSGFFYSLAGYVGGL